VGVLVATVVKGMDDIIHFAILFLIIYVTFAFTGTWAFGKERAEFVTFEDGFQAGSSRATNECSDCKRESCHQDPFDFESRSCTTSPTLGWFFRHHLQIPFLLLRQSRFKFFKLRRHIIRQ